VDPVSHGDFALVIIKHIKNNTVSWISDDLKQFCSSFTIAGSNQTDTSTTSQSISDSTSNSITRVANPNLSNISVNSMNSQDILEQINASFRNLQKDQNDQINNQLNAFLSLSLTRNVKEEHLKDLQILFDKLVFKQNMFTINKSYLDNDILPKSLLQFPEPRFKDDPLYIQGFNEIKKEFQIKILKFNSDYLKSKQDELEIEVKNKVEFIAKFDNKINDKLSILKAEAAKKHEKQLRASNEKIQNLINKTTGVNNNSNANANVQSNSNLNTTLSNTNVTNHSHTQTNRRRTDRYMNRTNRSQNVSNNSNKNCNRQNNNSREYVDNGFTNRNHNGSNSNSNSNQRSTRANNVNNKNSTNRRSNSTRRATSINGNRSTISNSLYSSNQSNLSNHNTSHQQRSSNTNANQSSNMQNQ